MIFDELLYSPQWVSNFQLLPVQSTEQTGSFPRLHTHTTIGGLAPTSGHWRFEPGLGADVEISETLLLCCGFRLTLANDQVGELLHPEPGVFVGCLPGRSKPNLFSSQQETTTDGAFSFLTDQDQTIGLWSSLENNQRTIVLVQVQGNREDCQAVIEKFIPGITKRIVEIWESELSKRERWCSHISSDPEPNTTGLAFERLEGLIESRAGIFEGPWIRDEDLDIRGMSLNTTFQVIPAIAGYQPEMASELLKTVLGLSRLDTGAWAAAYTLEGALDSSQPALPCLAAAVMELPKQVRDQIDIPLFSDHYLKHIKHFLLSSSDPLPQWPSAATALTPEVTDPDSLKQFDLAALLVTEIENLQKLTGNKTLLEDERKQLATEIFQSFWSSKRKRLLDKTTEGDFASRVTVGSLLPLLWNNCPKTEAASLCQCLLNPDELRTSEGIRQWQPKKEDPIPPPVKQQTQLLFLPLLNRLSAEAGSLLSADWHRMIEADPEYSHAESAAMRIRLIPFAQRINPHLEKYPAWVRSMEKHRKTIITSAAVILLLIPTGFSIYLGLRHSYGHKEELLQSGHAKTLVTMGDYQQAEEVYTRLISHTRMESRLNQYYLDRGNLRFKQNQFKDAMDDYLKAIELDPLGELYKARWNLAQVYARLDRNEDAINVLKAFNEEYGEELPDIRRSAEYAILLWQK